VSRTAATRDALVLAIQGSLSSQQPTTPGLGIGSAFSRVMTTRVGEPRQAQSGRGQGSTSMAYNHPVDGGILLDNLLHTMTEDRKRKRGRRDSLPGETFSMLTLEGNAVKAPEGTPNEKLCVLCLEHFKNVILDPCGHIVYCVQCARSLQIGDKCPVCRAFYQKAIVSYF